MPRWNENLHPPNGFEFIDAEKIRHTGKNIHDLISTVAAYRTRRGLDAGDPIAEVNRQLCEKYPSRCLNGNAKTKGATSRPRGASLGTRISGWLRVIWLKASRKQLEFVTDEESKRRAQICAGCAEHVAMPGGCAACSETVHQISFQVRAGRDKYTAPLLMCKFAATDLRVDALLKQPVSETAPAHCWKTGIPLE